MNIPAIRIDIPINILIILFITFFRLSLKIQQSTSDQLLSTIVFLYKHSKRVEFSGHSHFTSYFFLQIDCTRIRQNLLNKIRKALPYDFYSQFFDLTVLARFYLSSTPRIVTPAFCRQGVTACLTASIRPQPHHISSDLAGSGSS